MNDGAQVVVEDCVILVFALPGVADFTTLLAAVEHLAAEVPAARALQEVAAESGHVADLWRRRRAGGLRQSGVLLDDDGIVGELRQRDERPNREAFIVFADLIEAWD